MITVLPEIARAAEQRRGSLAFEAEIKELGGKLIYSPVGPQWLYLATGDEGVEISVVPTNVDLYNGNNPLKGKGGRNERVTDDWLERLSKVSTLRRVDLSNSAIQGPGLRHLAGLTSLREVNLTLTPLNDTGLEAIADLPISGRFWFAHTHFTDAGAVHLAKLTQLKRCGIGSKAPASSGAAVAALEKLPLEELALLDNQADAVGLAHAAKIATLRKLDVSYAPTIQDDSLPLVAQLLKLEEFKLGGAQVTDDGLQSFAATKSL